MLGPHGPGESDSAGLAGRRMYILKELLGAAHALLQGPRSGEPLGLPSSTDIVNMSPGAGRGARV